MSQPPAGRRDRVLDLVFLLGLLGKGIDGLAELVGGIVMLLITPGQLLEVVRAFTAHERTEDPHDLLVTVLLHGVQHLDTGTAHFVAAYLLLHGVVKVAIVGALLLGSRRIYPWAIAALTIFLLYQAYQLIVAPSALLVLLTVLDALILALTWREWRHGRTLHQTWRSTLDWVLRRPQPQAT